eukprot:4464358-Prymnesium_polylepis.1
MGCTTPTREAGATPPSALQPRAAVAECHAHSARVSFTSSGSPTRGAGAQLLAALQPNTAVAALSAMHAQHE